MKIKRRKAVAEIEIERVVREELREGG